MIIEWPFPLASVVPSLRPDENMDVVTGVEGYASTDRTFARHLEMDEFLQTLLFNLIVNQGTIDDSPPSRSAKLSILCGLLTRAAFAAEQKLLFLTKWEETVSEDERSAMWNDAKDVNDEVENTLTVLRHFQTSFSPNLDTSVETLEALKGNPIAGHQVVETDDETEAETEAESI